MTKAKKKRSYKVKHTRVILCMKIRFITMAVVQTCHAYVKLQFLLWRENFKRTCCNNWWAVLHNCMPLKVSWRYEILIKALVELFFWAHFQLVRSSYENSLNFIILKKFLSYKNSSSFILFSQEFYHWSDFFIVSCKCKLNYGNYTFCTFQ